MDHITYILTHTGQTYAELAEKTGLTTDEVHRIISQKRRDVFLRIEMSRIHKRAIRNAKRITHD